MPIHRSLKVARRDPATGTTPDTFGQIVTALDDLDQSIANLLLTPKGSVPTEPAKGATGPASSTVTPTSASRC